MPRMYFTGERRPKNLAKELPGEPAGGYHCNTKVRTHGLLRATLDRVLPVGPVLSVLLNTLQSRPHLTTYNTPPRSLCKAATAAGTCVSTNSGLQFIRGFGGHAHACVHTCTTSHSALAQLAAGAVQAPGLSLSRLFFQARSEGGAVSAALLFNRVI